MPVPLIMLAGGALVGFIAGRGVSGAGEIVKWAVIGAAGYYGLKALRG